MTYFYFLFMINITEAYLHHTPTESKVVLYYFVIVLLIAGQNIALYFSLLLCVNTVCATISNQSTDYIVIALASWVGVMT